MKSAFKPYIIHLLTFLTLIFATEGINACELPSLSRVWYVQMDNNNTQDGLSWNTAFSRLQDALAAAEKGDQIWIAEGNYFPSSTNDRSESFRVDKSIEIYGGFAGNETAISQRDIENHPTVLDGNINGGGLNGNSYQVIQVYTTGKIIIDGIFIINGNGNDSNSHGAGLVVENQNNTGSDTLVLRNCQFNNNLNKDRGGAGLHVAIGQEVNFFMQMKNCRIERNTSNLGGGSRFNIIDSAQANLFIDSCSWFSNVANVNPAGAGFFQVSESAYFNIRMKHIDVRDNWSGSWAGAFAFYESQSNWHEAMKIHIEKSKIINNTGFLSTGAIITVPDYSFIYLTLWDCLIEGNTSPRGHSGALSLDGGINRNGGTWFVAFNCIFKDNSAKGGQGGAVGTVGTRTNELYKGQVRAIFNNCLFYGNQSSQEGSVIYAHKFDSKDRIQFHNTIFWNNTSVDNTLVFLEDATNIEFEYCLVSQENCQSMYSGTGAININCKEGMIYDEDPLFQDGPNGDFELRKASPAIDAGNRWLIALPTDYAGKDRIVNDTVDIGPLEFGKCFFENKTLNYTCNIQEVGIEKDTISTPNDACDTIMIHETILEGADTAWIQAMSCVYEEVGLVIDTFKNNNGCDSFVFFETGYRPAYYSTTQIDTCEPSLWGTKIDTFASLNGCDSLVEFNFIQPPVQIIIDAPEEYTAQPGESIMVDVSTNLEPHTILWSPSTGLSCTDCLEPNVSVEEDQRYILTVTDENGCSDEIGIQFIIQRQGDYYIPNAFSPNGDGINDLFRVEFSEESGYSLQLLQIFDRWGNLIFSTGGGYQTSWDGTYRGSECAQAIYLYHIQIKSPDRKLHVRNGSLFLDRTR